ncbi:maleylpyruvate isomerase family mycothiol-dependent enzyme [Actinokineospora globicatena]|uniref:Mycothiol-dependent maleylpyruvate isomerase metal-binding domain-containing protein n=1 Tax=Actinokineospora globicatena TaxID=103729 RepID=A0A9W6QUA8_9PSEU|nr:maleylpyruvate isomerase family mycothiol-dependent enzyme [Actinokineospora globicatena]GLW94945.1 hypothetical protein Aglo03_57610 [Actinokineospora globicatena]
MDITQLAVALRDQTAALATALTGTDPDAPVPTCPQWRVRHLIGHADQALRWSADIARTGQPTAVPDPLLSDPGDPATWLESMRADADGLITAVGEGTTPVWTFFGTLPSRFWLRRMVTDMTIHRADAAIAAGQSYEVDAALAEEVITEGLELLTSPATLALRPTLVELRGTGETILLRADSGRGWLITRKPDGPTFEDTTGDVDATVAVSGTVQDLLWLFSQRLTPDDQRVTVTGDRSQLDHWLAHTEF